MKNLQSPTEFLRIVEGMVSYVDAECKEKDSGKAVYCVAVDMIDGKEKAIMCATGDLEKLARVMATTICTHKESNTLYTKINNYIERIGKNILNNGK